MKTNVNRPSVPRVYIDDVPCGEVFSWGTHQEWYIRTSRPIITVAVSLANGTTLDKDALAGIVLTLAKSASVTIEV